METYRICFPISLVVCVYQRRMVKNQNYFLTMKTKKKQRKTLFFYFRFVCCFLWFRLHKIQTQSCVFQNRLGGENNNNNAGCTVFFFQESRNNKENQEKKMASWNQKMAKMAFRRSKFRRLAWGDGDPYPFTPRATFRYQWDDWPLWEKLWHVAFGIVGIQFALWAWYSKSNSRMDWAREEALRRMRLRREAQELMILEDMTFDSDIQPDRR